MKGEIFALALYRKQSNLTQMQLSTKLGVSQSAVGMWETGYRKPDIIILKKISKILGCTTDELLSTIDV